MLSMRTRAPHLPIMLEFCRPASRALIRQLLLQPRQLRLDFSPLVVAALLLECCLEACTLRWQHIVKQERIAMCKRVPVKCLATYGSIKSWVF